MTEEPDETDKRQQLRFTSSEIRRIYSERKQKEFPFSSRYDGYFALAAEICLKVDAVPKDFVDAQFAAIDKEKMQVAFLYSDKAADLYRKYMDLRKLPLQDLYEVERWYLKRQVINANRTLEESLLDDDVDLHPWFRICISKEPIQSVIDKYIDAAREEMNVQLKRFLIAKNLDYKRIINE